MDEHKASKQELEQQIKDKNLAILSASDGVSNLMVYNHENFAHRYLETTVDSEIKCERLGDKYWTSSVEPDVFMALKWKHEKLKPVLIDLCKQYPGQASKQIQLKLELSTEFIETKKIICHSRINWDFPHFQNSEKEISMSETYEFSDLLELRNHHAAVLERVAELF